MEEDKLLRKLARARAENNLELRASICRKLAEIYVSEERYEAALEVYNEEKGVCAELRKLIEVAVANRMIGEVYSSMGEYKEALKYQKQHLELAKAEGHLIEEQRALATIGRTYFCMAESISSANEVNYKKTLKEAKQAYILSLRVCNKLQGVSRIELMQMKSRLMLNIGLVLECQGDVEKGIENIKMAISINVKEDLFEDTYRCYASLALLYSRQKNSVKALRYFDLAQEVAERLPDKVPLLCDTLLSKAEIYFSQANFQAAKASLLKAYKLHPPPGNDKQLIEKNLKIAITLCQTEEELLKTSDNNFQGLKKLYESMGDACCAVKNFEKALIYYHKMLQCAEIIGDGDSELMPIYVSLAQTYKDNENYVKALEYMHKEFALWKNNPAEACKTALHMAQLLELKGEGHEEIEKMYKQASALANEARCEKLELTVLNQYLDFQKQHGNIPGSSETLKRIEEIKMNLADAESLNSDSDAVDDLGTQDICGNICLEEFIEEEGENEEFDRPRQGRKPNQKIRIRKNEKGETQLHVACIAGNIQRVKKLLEMDHAVNVQDNGGWLPLHEACNHGFYEIVELLLDHGASINSTGGKGTGGITALHDAASNGHLRVMELLLDRGALIDVHTDSIGKNGKRRLVNSSKALNVKVLAEGDTPLDCLEEWCKRNGNLSPEDVPLFTAVKDRLKVALDKAGVRTRRAQLKTSIGVNSAYVGGSGDGIVNEHARSNQRANKVNLRRTLEDEVCSRKRWRKISTGSSESEEDVVEPRGRRQRLVSPLESDANSSDSSDHPLLTESVDQDLNIDGASEYQRVMKGLRDRQIPESTRKIPERTVPKGGAFLVEGEVGDDWLENDLAGNARTQKRHRTTNLQRSDVSEYIGSSRREPKVLRLDDDGNMLVVSDASSESDDQARGNTIEQVTSVPDQERLPATTLPTCGSAQQTSLLKSGFTRLPLANPNTGGINALPAIRSVIHTIKVRVEDKLMLVPIASAEIDQHNISWLANQAAKRFLKMEGKEPMLTLLTKDGASLCPDDCVSIVIDHDELLSQVTSWKLAPITKRYSEACKAASSATDSHIQSCLESCQFSQVLMLHELALTVPELQPVFQTLRPQHDLRELHLGGNILLDDGLEILVGCLSKLWSLEVLDLSCNNLSYYGLGLLCDLVTKSGPLLPVLRVLNLGYNDFYEDDWLENIHGILKAVKSLQSLSLQACSLTARAFNDWNGREPALYYISHVKELDISDNALGKEGVDGFLRYLDSNVVTSLNVDGTGEQSIAASLISFLEKAELLTLRELDLSNCNIIDEDLPYLFRCLKKADSLQSLSLCNNFQLSSIIFQHIASLPNPPPKIDLSGCDKLLCSGGPSVHWMENNFLKKLQSLTVTKTRNQEEENSSFPIDLNPLEEMWKQIWGSKAVVENGPIGLLVLSVIDQSMDVQL